MAPLELVLLREANGKVFAIEMSGGERRIRGVGRIDPETTLKGLEIGNRITIGTKVFTRIHPGLPELRTSMARRAQVITPKDAGLLIAWMGIGQDDRVLEAGFGSGGLAMQLARVLGPNGQLISVERRDDHAEVGEVNLRRCEATFSDMCTWTLIHGDVSEVTDEILEIVEYLDAIILDMPEPWHAIPSGSNLLRIGGRLACYCPSPDQLSNSWSAAEDAGLTIEWAGEMIERRWTRTKRGGVRPGNTPIGHTAFLLIAMKAPDEEE